MGGPVMRTLYILAALHSAILLSGTPSAPTNLSEEDRKEIIERGLDRLDAAVSRIRGQKGNLNSQKIVDSFWFSELAWEIDFEGACKEAAQALDGLRKLGASDSQLIDARQNLKNALAEYERALEAASDDLKKELLNKAVASLMTVVILAANTYISRGTDALKYDAATIRTRGIRGNASYIRGQVTQNLRKLRPSELRQHTKKAATDAWETVRDSGKMKRLLCEKIGRALVMAGVGVSVSTVGTAAQQGLEYTIDGTPLDWSQYPNRMLWGAGGGATIGMFPPLAPPAMAVAPYLGTQAAMDAFHHEKYGLGLGNLLNGPGLVVTMPLLMRRFQFGLFAGAGGGCPGGA